MSQCSGDREDAAGVTVADVRPRTPAASVGLKRGDRVLAINGHALRDAIDFQFHAADDRLTLLVERIGGTRAIALFSRAAAVFGSTSPSIPSKSFSTARESQ